MWIEFSGQGLNPDPRQCKRGVLATGPSGIVPPVCLFSPLFMPGGFHEQRSLASYSPRDHKASDTTKRLSTHSWLTMLCYFQVYSRVIQLCIYMYLFFFKFSHLGYFPSVYKWDLHPWLVPKSAHPLPQPAPGSPGFPSQSQDFWRELPKQKIQNCFGHNFARLSRTESLQCMCPQGMRPGRLKNRVVSSWSRLLLRQKFFEINFFHRLSRVKSLKNY